MQEEQSDSGGALHRHLLSLKMPPDDSAQDAIRRLVWAYVDDGKRRGWPPERLIIAVKDIARDAGLRPTRLVVSPDARITNLDQLLAEMVGWCIQRYYADPQ